MVRARKVDQQTLAAVLAPPPPGAQLTFGTYVGLWLKRREKVRPKSVLTDTGRLNNYALPTFASAPLTSISAAWLRQWVAALVGSELAPRTVRRAYEVLSWVMRDATIDGHLAATPCVLGPADLPPDEDDDPEWRDGFPLTHDELVALLTCDEIPIARRVLWTIAAFSGARIGEVAALRWSDYRARLPPVPELFVARSWDYKKGEFDATKTKAIKRVPVHPVLEQTLTWWHDLGWAPTFKRLPHRDDLIVPTSKLTPYSAWNAGDRFERDLRTAGLRDEGRSPHCLRSTFHTLARAAGADRSVIRLVTHARPSDVVEGYTRTDWERLSAEVLRIDVDIRVAPEPPSTGEQMSIRFPTRFAGR